jgi:hypothetical protein
LDGTNRTVNIKGSIRIKRNFIIMIITIILEVRIPSEKWFGLDAASTAIWDCLDDKAKSIILGYTKSEPQQAWLPTNTSNF